MEALSYASALLTLKIDGLESASMKIPALILGLCAYACGVLAQAPIVTTVINKVGGSTNVVDIPAGQAARVATIYEGNVLIEKEGARFYTEDPGYTIQGPARFLFVSWGDEPVLSEPALLTLERWPIVEPDGVVTLAQSTNLVTVAMESSTNLVAWTPATNGVYSTPDSPRFFRVRATRR